jgi:TDG/mug DNA glycosylase family protein
LSERDLPGALHLPPLPDHLGPNLQILFIGFNPGETSARMGHYYGYAGNRFWWLLWQSGLTDRLLTAGEDATLPTCYSYGLTDLVDRPSKSSGDLAGWELKEGRPALLAKIAQYEPRIACYNGKGVYAALSGVKQPAYGLQLASMVPGTRDFVAASPSGRSREPIATKLALYQQLRDLIQKGH